jgi:hypothetical protein
MDIGGVVSGMQICGNGTPMNLTGNQPNAGSFEISNNPSSGFVSNALGLLNGASGLATYDPAGPSLAPGSAQTSYYIRYSFQGPGCTGFARTTEEIKINPQPNITFPAGNVAPGTAFCYSQDAIPPTITLNTNPTTGVVLTGYGITDNSGGNATFNPTLAYQQSSLANNQNPTTDQTQRNIVITATRTDAFSCSNIATINYTVNPLPTATFSPSRVNFCFEEALPTTLSGSENNVSYQFIYKSTTSPANYTPPLIVTSTTDFLPSSYFEDAVDHGANPLATLEFDVIYTSINATTGCTHKKAPVTLKISPQIPPEMAGVNHGDIFCSNTTDKEFTFNPPNGTFRINGVAEPFSNGKYIFDPPIDGPAGGTDYAFSYTVITGVSCPNTQNKTVKVLPSPRALFSVTAQCDTALIAYDAQPSTNLPSAVYTWSLSDAIKVGQNVQHRFPGVSTYSVQLQVEHPAYLGNPALACADSVRYDQVIGPYPRPKLTFSNVCEGDQTEFEVTSEIPISRVKWDFGDGVTTGFGLLSANIGATNTTNTFENPIHNYANASTVIPYTVSVTAKTADINGGCETLISRDVSILKQFTPMPTSPYFMENQDGGKGFWVVEDTKNNTTWEFDVSNKVAITSTTPVWITNADGPYAGGENAYVNSPCFDLSNFTRPVFSISHFTNTEFSDGALVQFSTDGGASWQPLGGINSGLDWYNAIAISANPGSQSGTILGWSGNTQTAWKNGKHSLDVIPGNQRDKVRFRVAFSSFTNTSSKEGFAFNNVNIEERNRTILVENFTNLTSTNNNTQFKNFRSANVGTDLVKLQYHTSVAGADQLFNDNAVDQNARAAFYGVTQSMHAFIDGGFDQSAANKTFTAPWIDNYFTLRTLVSSPLTVAIDYPGTSTDQFDVNVSLKALENIPLGKYNVFIAIAEQEVMGQAYVLRKMLPSASGTQLTALTKDAEQIVTVSYDMRNVTRNPDGTFKPIAVIAFVQEIEKKDVLQTTIRLDAAPVSTIVTGIENGSGNAFTVYPNPADQQMTIILPEPSKQRAALQLFDQMGKLVYESRLEKGDSEKTIATNALAGGVYLIQIDSPKGALRKKVMVLHQH